MTQVILLYQCNHCHKVNATEGYEHELPPACNGCGQHVRVILCLPRLEVVDG